MKTIKHTLLIILFSLSYSCKAQQITIHQQISNYSNQITGVWLAEDDANYKLDFSVNGICKEYEGNELISTYNYSIVGTNCNAFSAPNTIYLKWIDISDLQVTCFEISNITEDSLSLLIIDKAKILFLNKQ